MNARVALACVALAACADRCGASPLDGTYLTSLEDRPDGGAHIVTSPTLTFKTHATGTEREFELSFVTWTSETCTLRATRDASGALKASGESCSVTTTESPLTVALAVADGGANQVLKTVVVSLEGGKLDEATLELELSFRLGPAVQNVHAKGARSR